MTTDGIHITTQAQADAVPTYSRGLWPGDPVQWFMTPAVPRGFLATRTCTFTHLATPVEQAAADRAEGVADATILREFVANEVDGWAILDGIADRMEARARRTLPDELADAYQAQQTPAIERVDAHTVKITVPQGDGSTASFTVPTAPLRAALDAEMGQ